MAAREPQAKDPSDEAYYFVLDDADHVVHVDAKRADLASPFLGQVLWDRLPGAEPLLRPQFEEARSTGRAVEFTVFYAGRTKSIRAIPAADGLAVHVEPLTKVDVRTLARLAESLRQVEAELAAREPVPHDRPAPSFLRALP